MIDVTGPKVLIPAVLFILLSPGLFLQLPSLAFQSGQTSIPSVLIHTLVFVVLYSLIARSMNIVLTNTDLIVTGLLFALLSPGMLLTLPPVAGSGVFASGKTGVAPVMTHALVYAVVFALLRKQFPQVY
jgi:hypothetical protein